MEFDKQGRIIIPTYLQEFASLEKEVVIIGSLDSNISIEQPQPLFEEKSDSLPGFVTVRDAIGNLPAIPDGGGEIEMDFDFPSKSPYDMLMQKEIDFDKFYKLMCTK